MTNTVQNTKTPVTNEVEKKLPSHLYAKHQEKGAYKKKANPFTYNYVIMDAVIFEVFKETTMKDISTALKEPMARVQYRVKVLREEGLVARKVKFKTRKVNAKAITKSNNKKRVA
tara:strand:- start:83 stop:427 length:345 start_codon:yes stop_codon:yes gene_type:complete